MEILIKEHLTEEEKQEVLALFNKVLFFSIGQDFNFTDSIGQNNQIKYLLAYEEKKLVCYSKIIETKLRRLPFIKFAQIKFGPVYIDNNSLLECLKKTYDYYLQHRFTSLTVQLGNFVGNDSEFIETYLQKDGYFFKTQYDRLNQSTLIIDLEQSIQEIESTFTTHLKRNLKKSTSKNIQVYELTDFSDLQKIEDVYTRMAKARNLKGFDHKFFQDKVTDIKEKGIGKIFYSLTSENKVLGTAFIFFEGKKCIYYLGFSDPEEKSLPALHSVFWEAIQWSKKNGFKLFVLGGYGHYATENDQVFYINNFKRNFTENYFFYPKRMIFEMSKLKSIVANFLLKGF